MKICEIWQNLIKRYSFNIFLWFTILDIIYIACLTNFKFGINIENCSNGYFLNSLIYQTIKCVILYLIYRYEEKHQKYITKHFFTKGLIYKIAAIVLLIGAILSLLIFLCFGVDYFLSVLYKIVPAPSYFVYTYIFKPCYNFIQFIWSLYAVPLTLFILTILKYIYLAFEGIGKHHIFHLFEIPLKFIANILMEYIANICTAFAFVLVLFGMMMSG